MFLPWDRDERLQMQFEELASGLAAGLSPAELGGAANAAGLWRSLGIAVGDLDPVEIAIFDAAERAGTLPDALRARAKARGARAALARRLVDALAYPVLLILTAIGVAILLSVIGSPHRGSSWGFPVVVTAVVVAVVLFLRRASHSERSRRWPILGPLLRDRGLLPYLHALHDLYDAGIPLRDAHEAATRTIPFEWLRMRMFVAGERLGAGEPFVESLGHADALDEETRRILGPAERAGDLSNALKRAAARRQDTFERGLARLARIARIVAMLIAIGIVLRFVTSFWLGFYRGM
jgi:type II secretory pathway component PulF